MPVLVTRPREQATGWVQRLQQAGVAAEALPLLAIAPVADAQAVRQAWQELPAQGFVMFVSANAVAHFFAQRPPGAAWPAGLRAGSTGPGTTEALLARGLTPAQVVAPAQPPFETEGLWALIQHETWRGQRVLLVRGEGGRDWLQAQWREAGAQVQVLPAYRRLAPQWSAAEQALARAALAAPQQHLWWFSSGEAIAHLPELTGVPPQATAWAASQALASHPRIAERARSLGFGQVLEVSPLLGDVVQQARRLLG